MRKNVKKGMKGLNFWAKLVNHKRTVTLDNDIHDTAQHR